MATYINYAGAEDEDATLQGAEWLRNVIRGGADSEGESAEKEFFSKFQELYLEAQENPKRYSSIMGNIVDLFLNNCPELIGKIPQYNRVEEKTKEVEGFFAIVMNMICQLDDEEHLEVSTMRLCDMFGSSQANNKELRLRLLMWLYNSLPPNVPLRYKIFKHILEYSAKADLFEQVAPYLEFLENWMVDWEISANEKRNLYKEIQAHCRNLNKKMDAFHYLKKHMLLFEGVDQKELSSDANQASAVQLVKDAIELPTVLQVDDVLNLDAVKYLSKTKHKDLVLLGEIFLSGTVDDLRKFNEKNKKLFKDHDLVYDDAMSKMRLLTLATLAQGKSEIPLSDIAAALQEKPDQVEKCVVKAISEDVIDGRIDQLSHKVLVKSAFQRKFGKEEWQILDEKLDKWVDNLENLITMVGQQKEREKMAAGN